MLQVRNYSPTLPLFVSISSVLFRGVTYLRGDELPSMLPAKHRAMWQSKKAAHVAPKVKARAVAVVDAVELDIKRKRRK